MRKLSRSENMSRIRSRDTRPEIELRKALWQQGLRYRLEYDLPGRPDLAFIGPRVAIFVDGCFWHGCPVHYSAPSTRQEFWARKLRDNVERDLGVDDTLNRLGWRPFHVWQHELKDARLVLRRIALSLKETPLSRKGDDAPRVRTPPADVVAEPVAIYWRVDTPWYQCGCGSIDVRVLAVSSPGSLRPNAKQRPRQAELVCVACRQVFERQPMKCDDLHS